MKNKKGFTLIELLAIIVILAIIAVITTPIILNVIENAKKGAAQDSALGYKDAVHKYYASRLSIDSNFQMVDSTYEIESNGYLSDGTNTYEVQIDGKVPANGFVQIERNKVTNACIGFDDYAVLIVDGSISDTLKGECSSVSEIIGSDGPELAIGTSYPFAYVTGDNKEQTLEIVRSGYYKLEVWGAQGGSSTTTGGYGGYSSGYVRLTRGTILYINVGEQPTDLNGGYNGGGQAGTAYNARGGGGATHIALSTGTLASFDSDEDGVADSNEIGNILIVAGGGGGSDHYESGSNGGAGGGYIGNSGGVFGFGDAQLYTVAAGGTQTSGGTSGIGAGSGQNGSFGHGGSHYGNHGGGGGGGFYGGGGGSYNSGIVGSGAGGSGYIGYSAMTNGVMYCYGCVENGNSGVKTYATTGDSKDSVSCPNGYSSDPTTNCAKAGHGSALITYVGNSVVPSASGTTFYFPYLAYESDKEQVLHITEDGYYKLEVWGASGGDASVNSGYIGGYGGYSSGSVYLTAGTDLYINVGGKGLNASSINTTVAGGYNGGGSSLNTVSDCDSFYISSGGGATHIALSSGTLDTFADNNEIDDILIVAGAGGGSLYCNGWNFGNGGHGGGKVGGEAYSLGSDSASNNGHGTGGTQETAGCIYRSSGLTTCSDFGASKELTTTHIGGGGGYYGGGIGILGSGGGGSGYVGYSDLNNGVMYCYGCTDDNSSGARTVSTTGSNRDTTNCPNGYSNSALSNCAKSGNGYAVITYIGESLN